MFYPFFRVIIVTVGYAIGFFSFRRVPKREIFAVVIAYEKNLCPFFDYSQAE